MAEAGNEEEKAAEVDLEAAEKEATEGEAMVDEANDEVMAEKKAAEEEAMLRTPNTEVMANRVNATSTTMEEMWKGRWQRRMKW